MAKKGKRKAAPGDVATNRQASFRYELTDRLECGMQLHGTEVKALRTVGGQLKDGFVAVRNGELWLHNVHIPPYPPAARENHEPDRDRKLLAKRKDIEKLVGQVSEKGYTLVPTRIYFQGPWAKIEIALGRGKDLYDKREAIKERESKREMARDVRDAMR